MADVELSSAERKQKLQEFVQKSKARRDALNQNLAQQANVRAEQHSKQKTWAQQQIAAEAEQAEQKKANFIEWKRKQKEQKEAIAKMMKEKREEKERLERIAAEKKEAERKKKEYMRTLRWSSATSMAKEKRKKVAKEAKDFALKDAEHDFTRDTELAEKEHKQRTTSIEKDANKRRGMLDGQLEQILEEIEQDTKQLQNMLFKKEAMAKQAIVQQMERKKAMAKQKPLPQLQRQALEAVAREEKLLLRRHTDTYNKARQDIEVQRNTRINTAKKQTKKSYDAISMEERNDLQKSKTTLHQTKLALQTKFKNDRQLAEEREQEILHMTLEEAVGLKKVEDLDED